MAVAVAAALLVITGCGGSDSESLTKPEYTRKANAVCDQGLQEREEQLKVLLGQAGQNATKAEQEKLVLKLIPTYEKTTSDLAELDAPAGEEKKVETIIEAREEAAERVRSDPGSALVGNVPFVKSNELAEAYGLDSCTS